MIRRTATLALISVLLSACGGGGDSSSTATPSTPVSGKVVDGYIKGATVFWDCNGNYTLDAGEISTTSAAGGDYTIVKSENTACRLIAYIGSDAIDEDNPGSTVGSAYTMLAAPGIPNLITPFTTMIAGHIYSGTAKSVDEADKAIQSAYKLDHSALQDYVAGAMPQSHAIAKSIVESLKKPVTIDASDVVDVLKTIQAAHVSITTAIGDNVTGLGYMATAQLALVPYRYIPNCLLCEPYNSKLNASNIAVRTTNYPSEADNAFLDDIATYINANHLADRGEIDWRFVDNAKLESWLVEFHRRNLGSTDPTFQQKVDAMRQERNAALAAAGLTLNSSTPPYHWYSLAAYGEFFSNDPKATLDFGITELSIIGKSVEDGYLLGAPLGAVKPYSTGDILKFKTKYRHLKSIKGILSKFKKVASALKCSDDIGTVLLTDDPTTAQVSSLFSDCTGAVMDIIDTSNKVIKGTANVAVFGFDTTGNLTEQETLVLILKETSSAVDALTAFLEFSTDPVTTKIKSFIDLANQTLKSYIAGQDLLKASLSAKEEVWKAAFAAYEQEVLRARSQYAISYLSMVVSRSFTVIDSGKTAYIKSVTASTPSSGGTFTITASGKNLPSVSLTATLDGVTCAETGTPTDTERSYQCTPNRSVTIYAFILANGADLVAGTPRNITVTLPVPVCVAPQVLKGNACVLAISFDQPTLNALGIVGSGAYSLISGKDGHPAVKFNGVANPGSLRVPNRDALKFSSGVTFDMWVRIDSMTGMDGYGRTVTNGAYAMALLAKSHDVSGAAFMTNSLTAADSGTFIASYDTTMSGPTCTQAPHAIVPIGTWARITYVLSATQGVHGYVNGQQVWSCTGARPNFSVMNTRDLYIGKYSDSWYPMNGAMQDLNIYQKALSAAEVAALQ